MNDLDHRIACHVLQRLPAHQKIVSDINAAIGEDMQVRDSASEEVRRTRNRCRTIEGRLRSILKGSSGEVSEQVRSLQAVHIQCKIISSADESHQAGILTAWYVLPSVVWALLHGDALFAAADPCRSGISVTTGLLTMTWHTQCVCCASTSPTLLRDDFRRGAFV